MSPRRIRSVLVVALLSAAVAAVSTARFGPFPAEAQSSVLDRDLAKAIAAFKVRPLEVRRFEADAKFRLGQALFFDPVLSGPRVVSCATCHLFKYGTSDGLSRSIGVHKGGADGAHLHPRNALDLWNRDNPAIRALFWDGRVELLDARRRVFRSPLGHELPSGLESVLAVQALFPLVTPDEMLGDPGDTSPADLPGGHGGLPNDLVSGYARASEPARITDSHGRLMQRLLGGESRAAWQERYRVLFRQAYPRKTAFTIVDLVNAIAHFEGTAFVTRDSAWDRYLRGDPSALSPDAKRGAVLFYGRGRCAACHAGPLFSDFEYHSIGVFEADPRRRVPEDLGRGGVTRREQDRYTFRTPPLRNVANTAPYLHDGSEQSLRGAIERHGDPLGGAGKPDSAGSPANSTQIRAISHVLLPRLVLSAGEADNLLAFLLALSFEPPDLDALVPAEVPSGLAVTYRYRGRPGAP